MDSQIQALRARFSQLEDEELLGIVGEHASDYRPEAIQVAMEEIRSRGLDPTAGRKPGPQASDESPESEEALEDEEEEPEPEPEAETHDWVTCAICGGGLRSAVLLGENQIIAVFDDNREARFVKILVCPRCGNASMSVDMHTEVTE